MKKFAKFNRLHSDALDGNFLYMMNI